MTYPRTSLALPSPTPTSYLSCEILIPLCWQTLEIVNFLPSKNQGKRKEYRWRKLTQEKENGYSAHIYLLPSKINAK